ncbi:MULTISPECIES: ABC transporter ATP-binding protein [Chryseobacterium]|uniref:ABC transporter ATP-binding protein n=1 Tax=Chryseobacterium rhizosphaerae TaxID=395937 RepID=A0AAE3YE04_9FLAO|nr:MULTISPECIES: ATP-binding cassette domain-containing protein [Chryseobacterium]MDR6528660.1 ABC-2 type transport system ATP-binding protein [Chryseobacterium rhizosphaerae]REC72864.1 ABC transporter ATP-binding protein [Chryseobacterium rhizosphaerae]GEN67443.1 ABC transporter ATP-binding protein [Chryseobacterium rhizosphaerae]
MSILQAIQLSKQYNHVTALSGLNISVQKGEIFCLLGQNGAGKTTTINIFLGFLKASSGEALINGIPVEINGEATKKYIAYIPEVVQLYPHLTGIENLDFFSQMAGFRYSRAELALFLENTSLQQSAHHKKLSSYSKGMRQKVAIAIAVAKNADLILMDEPTSGLDPKATAEFTRICKDLAAEGKSILMATHDIFNAVNVGTRIGIMKEGCLVHTLEASSVTADELQKIYLETI